MDYWQNQIKQIIHYSKAERILDKKFADRWFPNRELLQHRQILWGCKKVDDLSRISLGSVILIAGYANSGKHLYLQNVVRSNIRNDNRIIYFSLKEPSYTVINMMLAAESMVNLEKLRTGMLTSDEWSRIAEAATLLEKGKFLLELYQSSDILNQYILSAIRCGNADIVIIDDLGGLGLANNSAVTSFMYHLRRAAAESGTIIFIVKDITVIPSRIDRRPLKSDPQINDLCRLSDVVQFLYHDEKEIFTEDEDSIKIELIMAKNYTSTVPRVVHLIGLPSYSILIDAQEGISSATKSIDKYSGIIAGLKTISEYLE